MPARSRRSDRGPEAGPVGQGQGARGARRHKQRVAAGPDQGGGGPGGPGARGPGYPKRQRPGGSGYFINRDQYRSQGERVQVPGPSWALPTPMLWEAGERPGSACAIEVKALKRRPPNVGGRPRP